MKFLPNQIKKELKFVEIVWWIFKLKAFKIDNFQICNVVKRLDLPLKIDLELSYTGTFFVVYYMY